MYDNLFRILTRDKSYENEYVMRAVMRLSSSVHEGVIPYLNQLMDKLVVILRRSCRVSRNLFDFDVFSHIHRIFLSFIFSKNIQRSFGLDLYSYHLSSSGKDQKYKWN